MTKVEAGQIPVSSQPAQIDVPFPLCYIESTLPDCATVVESIWR